MTEATIRFMVPPTAGGAEARAVLLRLARPFQVVRGAVNSGRMAEPFIYATPRSSSAPAATAVVGHSRPTAG